MPDLGGRSPGEPGRPPGYDAAVARSEHLDDQDPLRGWPDRFAAAPDVVAYFDGNSLGRPLRSSLDALASFASGAWGGRLIRGWADGWMEWPCGLGDRLGRAALGAAPGQVVVADSTSVLLYKLARAALDASSARRSIVVDPRDFPTDRYLLEGIAADREATVRWIPDAASGGAEAGGATPESIGAVLDADVALVVLSHVAYRSGWLADVAAITRVVHDAGALVLWDLSHSAGALPVRLDEWGVDLAVGCTYKYLGGGPGAPGFAYLRADLQGRLRQPVWGWMGSADPFGMGPGYEPAPGIRSVLSGTPPILAMVPLTASVEVLHEVGVEALRARSLLLTELVLDLADSWLAPLGFRLASPRPPASRGGHVTVCRADADAVCQRLWARGVLPDFRGPDAIRIGPAPLSTRFSEVVAGMSALWEEAGGGGR